MNNVILMGRLTKDPEIRYGQTSNTGVASFSIAVDRKMKNKDGETLADFFKVSCFGQKAVFAEKYLRKGIKIVLKGEIRNDNYTNKEGQKIYGTQIIADEIEFAEPKASGKPEFPALGPVLGDVETTTTNTREEQDKALIQQLTEDLPFL